MTGTRRLVWAGGAALSAMALLLVFAASSLAERPISGSGEGEITSVEVVSSRQSGSNRIEERRIQGTVTGTFQGTFTEEVRGVVHGNGEVHFQGTGVFEGTLEACGSGVLHVRLEGRGQAGAAPVTVATLTVVDEASNTLPATGTATLHQDGVDLTYEVEFTCR